MARCARHNVETFLRCGKCDKPICPDCMYVGPAGTRCPDCATHKSSHQLFQVSTNRLAVGGLIGGTAAVVGGFVIAAAHRFGPLVLAWLGMIYGWCVAEAVLRSVQRRRGPQVEMAAGACALVIGAAGLAVWYVIARPELPLVQFLQQNPFVIVSLALGVFAAVSRVRYY